MIGERGERGAPLLVLRDSRLEVVGVRGDLVLCEAVLRWVLAGEAGVTLRGVLGVVRRGTTRGDAFSSLSNMHGEE